MDGGGNFRANFGVEKDGINLLAEDGSHSLGADITTGYPEFDHIFLKKLGWWNELTDAEKAAAEGKNWKTDLSGGIQRVVIMNHGCHPFGNAKARAVVWNFPDPIPLHREPLYTTRPDLIDKYPTHDDKQGVLAPADALPLGAGEEQGHRASSFPLIMTSGRLVEYEGGGEETRSNRWLAELQQDMFVEINPVAANDRGIRNGETGLGQDADRRAHQGDGDGHRARRPRDGVPAVPLLGPLAGRRPGGLLPAGCDADRPRRGASTPPPPTATTS